MTLAVSLWWAGCSNVLAAAAVTTHSYQLRVIRMSAAYGHLTEGNDGIRVDGIGRIRLMCWSSFMGESHRHWVTLKLSGRTGSLIVQSSKDAWDRDLGAMEMNSGSEWDHESGSLWRMDGLPLDKTAMALTWISSVLFCALKQLSPCLRSGEGLMLRSSQAASDPARRNAGRVSSCMCHEYTMIFSTLSFGGSCLLIQQFWCIMEEVLLERDGAPDNATGKASRGSHRKERHEIWIVRITGEEAGDGGSRRGQSSSVLSRKWHSSYTTPDGKHGRLQMTRVPRSDPPFLKLLCLFLCRLIVLTCDVIICFNCILLFCLFSHWMALYSLCQMMAGSCTYQKLFPYTWDSHR